MDVEKIGRAIASARKKANLTQEQLAEKAGVSVQAVSKWENGKNLPDIENLICIAEATDTPYSVLLEAGEAAGISSEKLTFRSRLFDEDNMFTRMRAFALAERLDETYRALQYMREKHVGQFRKKWKHSQELVQYINHPLLMACQAHALGIRDDCLLAAILLHDVVEDTGTRLEELPFSDEVRRIVGLLTFSADGFPSKEEAKKAYYDAIRKDGKACVVKIIDRCNNVSTMAGPFSREKTIDYIEETERYIFPLLKELKDHYPEYSDLAFLVKYHLLSVMEAVKNSIAL